MSSEIWVPIPNYEGYYEISNLSNIRSIHRSIPTKMGYLKPEKERMITQRISNKGYLTVTLSKHGHSHTHSVHKLMAQAFIPNPENKPIINHRNGNKLDNNSIESLEWATYSENTLHAYKTGLYAPNERHGRSIVDTCTGETYPSIRKAAESLKLDYSKCRHYLSGYTRNPTCLRYAA